ncbi:DUF6665 family protein [Tepidamorphus sp. 3E244]|uniref:DUF6665 family protein n=1 Tax=Tepidamorphus sp. 3E244 TaxID=3385498 RepID=UPI0038FC22C6
MSVRPPKAFSRQTQASPLAALEHELFEEQAGTLVRVAKTFEAQLAQLAGMAEDDPARDGLSTETARTLWMLTVQREVMGLPGGDELVKSYDIPADVRVKSGIVTRKAVPMRHPRLMR